MALDRERDDLPVSIVSCAAAVELGERTETGRGLLGERPPSVWGGDASSPATSAPSSPTHFFLHPVQDQSSVVVFWIILHLLLEVLTKF